MADTLSTRDQLARDLYVHNQGETPHSAFETADAFMAEVARRAPVAPRQRTAVPVGMVECPDCGGSCDGPDRCDGAGEVSQDACLTCDGKGLTPVAAVADTARTEVISAGAEARKLRVRLDSERKLRLAALALAAHYAVPPTNTDREHGKLDRALQRAAVRFTEQHPELLR